MARSEEQRIADLEAQIANLKARVAAKKVKKDPALKHVSAALRSIDQAASATEDKVMRQSLIEARTNLSACLQLKGVTLIPKGSAPKRVVRGGPVDANALLTYIRNNPGQRGEQVSAALGTDSTSMRPVMKQLIADRKVKTQGERRGMTYAAV